MCVCASHCEKADALSLSGFIGNDIYCLVFFFFFLVIFSSFVSYSANNAIMVDTSKAAYNVLEIFFFHLSFCLFLLDTLYITALLLLFVE